MAQFSNRVFLCPFFTSANTADRVNCEGGRVMMPGRDTTRDYSVRYCAGDWKQCSIARSLLKYYDNGTEERKA